MARRPQHVPEPETPGLDAFLGARRPGPIMGSAIRTWVRGLFEDAGEHTPAPYLNPDDHALRIMVMWRLARATATMKGLVAEDETLDSATDVHPSPWVSCFKPVMTPSTGAALRRQRAATVLTLHAAGEGLPLLPPRKDPDLLERWCDANALVAKEIGIWKTASGRKGALGLLDPHNCQVCDVTADQVMAFEELLIDEVLTLLLDGGERVAVKHFRGEHGLSRAEALGVIRLARAQILERGAGSMEEKRAMQEARLENYLARAKETMDMGGEMAAIKELAKIQGLTRSVPDNMAAEFLSVVKRVSAKQDDLTLDSRTRLLLDGRRAENVEPIVIEPTEPDPDDGDALAEFDRENQ